MRLKRFLLSLAFLLGCIAPAAAAFYFIGGEDIDIVAIGTVADSTSVGTFRPGYARASISVSATAFTGQTQDPPTHRFYIPAFGNQTTLWVHAQVFTQTTQTNIGPQGGQAIALISPDGFPRLLIIGNINTNASVVIATRNNAGTITNIATCTVGAWPTFNTLVQLDWFVNYSTSGSTTLYINNVNVCSFTGDVTTNSTTSLNDAFFANPVARGTNGFAFWSEIIVSPTDTRTLNLMTCAPQANGNTMAWTGSFANVNPVSINDAVTITTTSSAQIAEFTCPALPAGTWAIPAISQSIRAASGATGPQTYDFILRPATGATDYSVCAGTTPGAAFNNQFCQTSLNPACSCSWKPADFGAGMNAGLESRP